ncbi:MAG: hypothetical protein GY844_08595 [Bradyrhizobium sp.]|nr:hypothetical protein [Bradyrhizobium sp.]
MADLAMRARVVRLLSGDVRADDLSRLFLYARDRCDGREAVQEIGDFVAHHSERTKGIITRSTRDWFATARFAAARAQGEIDPQRLPVVMPEFLRANVQRLEQKYLRKAGLSKASAVKATAALASKLIRNADGTYSLPTTLTRDDITLFNVLAGSWVAKAAFDGERLCEDYWETLKSNGLISKSELREVSTLNAAVQLFAIANIHGCAVTMTDGTSIELRATPKDGPLGVSAAIPVQFKASGSIFLAADIFVTRLALDENCDPALLALENWDGALELGIDGKLRPLS